MRDYRVGEVKQADSARSPTPSRRPPRFRRSSRRRASLDDKVTFDAATGGERPASAAVHHQRGAERRRRLRQPRPRNHLEELPTRCWSATAAARWRRSRPARRLGPARDARADIVDNQVRALRKRQVIAAFKAGERKGAYWGIRTDIADYGAADALPCPSIATQALAAARRGLQAIDDQTPGAAHQLGLRDMRRGAAPLRHARARSRAVSISRRRGLEESR